MIRCKGCSTDSPTELGATEFCAECKPMPDREVLSDRYDGGDIERALEAYRRMDSKLSDRVDARRVVFGVLEQRDRLRADHAAACEEVARLRVENGHVKTENERLRGALHRICGMTADEAVDGSYGILVQFASRVHSIARHAVEPPDASTTKEASDG